MGSRCPSLPLRKFLQCETMALVPAPWGDSRLTRGWQIASQIAFTSVRMSSSCFTSAWRSQSCFAKSPAYDNAIRPSSIDYMYRLPLTAWAKKKVKDAKTWWLFIGQFLRMCVWHVSSMRIQFKVQTTVIYRKLGQTPLICKTEPSEM